MIDMDKLLSGAIPETLEEKTAAAGQLVRIARRIVPVTSLLIAAARRDHFRQSVTGWVEWCRTTFDFEASDRDHRRAIGEMLLDSRGNPALYRRLFVLDKEKLIAITRIPQSELSAFMGDSAVEKMSRDDVRAAVKAWLKEEAKDKGRPQQEELPGFAEIIGKVLSLPPSDMLDSIADDTTAKKSFDAGIGLFGAALEYKKHAETVDVEFLQSTRKMLLDEVAEIEAALAKAAQV